MKNIKKKLKEYLNSSIHYGHKVNELNFNMIPYVLTKKNGYHIININKIIKCLFLAGEILKEKMLNKNNILFVGTNKNFSYLIKKFTKKSKVFYINNRWLGGTLTN